MRWTGGLAGLSSTQVFEDALIENWWLEVRLALGIHDQWGVRGKSA